MFVDLIGAVYPFLLHLVINQFWFAINIVMIGQRLPFYN